MTFADILSAQKAGANGVVAKESQGQLVAIIRIFMQRYQWGRMASEPYLNAIQI